MTVTQNEVRVGVEELALGLSLAGKPGLAKGVLHATCGEMTADEERGRLLAAGHSLIARGLLSIDNGEPCLEETFGGILQDLSGSAYFITIDRRQGEEIRHMAFYCRGATILEERLIQGVVCTIAAVPDAQAALARGLEFLEVEPTESEDYAPVALPVSVLDKARAAAGQSGAAAEAVLRDAGVPEELGVALARDLSRPLYRGSCLRTATADDQFTSDRGFLWLRGSAGIWLMRLRSEGAEVWADILPGTKNLFSQELQALLA